MNKIKDINNLKLNSKIQSLNSYQLFILIPTKIKEFLELNKGKEINFKINNKKELVINFKWVLNNQFW